MIAKIKHVDSVSMKVDVEILGVKTI